MGEKIITIAVAGYGLRGQCYSDCAAQRPETMRVVAVADLIPEKVSAAKAKFQLPDDRCFLSAEEMLDKPRLADVMFVCTQDRQHVAMAMAAIEKGYHIMTEKPISPDVADCLKLQAHAHKYNRIVTVCHVLRYSPFYQEVKRVIDSGVLGEVRNLSAMEDVGYFHQAHSFVRGNWRNSTETSPMIMQKSCHDMDLLQWLLDRRCERVCSFGSLSYFRPDQAPEGAALRCLDGCTCKGECPYDAEKIYITNRYTGVRDNGGIWPCTAVTIDPTEENLYEALRTGPYGRCVFHCDNDVVDHQVVSLQFEGGATADFTMCAFTRSPGRRIRVMGTLGLLEGCAETGIVEVTPFGKATETLDVSSRISGQQGHAGGDFPLVDNTISMLLEQDQRKNLTSIDASVHSHVMAMAVEESRLHQGQSIEISAFEGRYLSCGTDPINTDELPPSGQCH